MGNIRLKVEKVFVMVIFSLKWHLMGQFGSSTDTSKISLTDTEADGASACRLHSSET